MSDDLPTGLDYATAVWATDVLEGEKPSESQRALGAPGQRLPGESDEEFRERFCRSLKVFAAKPITAKDVILRVLTSVRCSFAVDYRRSEVTVVCPDITDDEAKTIWGSLPVGTRLFINGRAWRPF